MKKLIVVLGLALPLASCFHVNNRTPYDQGSNLTHLLNFYENECLKPASNHEYPYDPDRAEICKIVKSKIASYNVDSITGNASNSNVGMGTTGSTALKPNADNTNNSKTTNGEPVSNANNPTKLNMESSTSQPVTTNKEVTSNEPTTPLTPTNSTSSSSSKNGTKSNTAT